MSGNGKRVLPASAATTSALIPIAPGAMAGTTAGYSPSNNELIDQLVGGLAQTARGPASDDRFFRHGDGSAPQDRIYSIDDEEVDEPPVPIPSTWRDAPKNDEPSWIVEQLKASAYGFIIGLFIVIPAVMLLTGHAERLPSWQAVAGYAQSATEKLGIADLLKGSLVTDRTAERRDPGDAAAPTRIAAPAPASEPPPAPKVAVSQPAPTAALSDNRIETPKARDPSQSATASIPTASEQSLTMREPVVASVAGVPRTAQETRGPSQSAANNITQPAPARAPEQRTTTTTAANVPATSAPQPATGTTTPAFTRPGQQPISSIAQARRTIRNGRMDDARVMLARLASRGDTEAIFALAETFDPNVLAAWGTRGEEANPEKAKMFYKMALGQGLTKAEARIRALQH